MLAKHPSSFGKQSKRWSEEEIKILEKAYPTALTTYEVLSLLPDRTWQDVKSKVRSLGIKKQVKTIRRGGWMPHEIAVLKDKYPLGGALEVQNLLPQRSTHNIHVKAFHLGISCQRLLWTENEENRLRQHYSETPVNQLMNELDRSYGAIRGKAWELRLKKNFPGVGALPLCIEDFELGRLVGLLDGEGSFTIDRTRDSFFPFISITNTNRLVLERVRKITNMGTIRVHQPKIPRHNIVYRWYVEKAKDVRSLCLTVERCLIVKREQAGVILQFLDLKERIWNKEISRQVGIKMLGKLAKKCSKLNRGRR